MSSSLLNAKLSRLKKPIIIALVLLCLYSICGFLIAPAIIKSKAPTIIADQLGRNATVKQIRINPFVLSLTVRGLELEEPNGERFVGFEELYVNFQLSSLFRLAFTFGEISLIAPLGHVKVLADGSLNFADLLSKLTQTESPQDQGGELPPVLIQRLNIEKGQFVFSDLSLPTPYEETFFPVELTLDNFSTRKDVDSHYIFTASWGEDTTFSWEGDLSINPMLSKGRFVLTGIKPRNLWKYILDLVHFEVTTGSLNVAGQYQAGFEEKNFHAELIDGEVQLNDFKLIEKGTDNQIVRLPLLSVRGIDLDLAKKKVEVLSLTSKDAHINGWLDSDGTFGIEKILSLDALEAKYKTKLKTTDESVPASQPWQVTVKEVMLENYGLEFEDRTVATPKRINLDSIKVDLKNVSNQKDSQAEISAVLKLNRTGIVQVNGQASINPVSADLSLKVAQNPVKPMQPYVDAVAPVELASGTISLEGRVKYRALGSDGPKVRFEGGAGIENLKTVDRRNSEVLYSLKSFSVQGLALEFDPNALSVSEVFISQPDFKVAIRPDGKINVVTILTMKDDTAKKGETGKKVESLLDRLVKYITYHLQGPMPITIDTVRIENGVLDFSDLFIKPKFAADAKNLRGSVKGLSSKPRTRADVLLEGEVNKYSPVKISGQINPLSEEKYADLVMSFKNFDLTTTSPYSGKFAGYRIEKGKLSLNLKYKVSGDDFSGENEIVVEQLTLGERVESPDATELPVSLAVALLKDSNGNIELDVPVEGDLNDPHFDYGKVVSDAVSKIITNIVSSPFAALGSLVGGSGGELSHIEFEFGSATLRPEQIEKLDKLAKALQERPGLRLEITGRADKEDDRSVLTEIENKAVDDGRLRLLAQERSKQIKTHLVETGGIPSERISLTREQIIESSEGDYVRINLTLARN
jgi:outer membrane protein OmpA-like peptidoglycan-associated protein